MASKPTSIDDDPRSLAELEASGVPMTDPNAPKVPELPELPDVAPWSLAAVGEALAERLYGKGRAVVRYPWPGCEAEDPEERAPVAWGALLPDRNQAARPAWRSLAKLAGAWTPDRLAVLGGATGRGKSALAIQVSEGVARAGAPGMRAPRWALTRWSRACWPSGREGMTVARCAPAPCSTGGVVRMTSGKPWPSS